MLILTRKVNESIETDNGIRITVTEIKDKQVKLGIDAPANVTIIRSELRQTNKDVEPMIMNGD